MKRVERVSKVSAAVSLALAAAALAVGASACGGDGNDTGKHDVWFMGAVIDGVTGAPVTSYTITLVYGPKTVTGDVDATGRFVLGPFPAWNDYGILIDAGTGYRSFSSYNSGIAPPAPPTTSTAADIYKADTSQVFNFDAYLFPTAVAAPNLDIAINKPMPPTGTPAPEPAAGTIRLQPTTQPSIQTQVSEVGGQLWSNDRDLFAAAVTNTFTGGKVTIPASSLVYGVNYQVTVYGVDGFQPATSTVQAGVTGSATVTLAPTTVPPLQLVSNTAANCKPPTMLTDTTSAQVSFVFNGRIQDGTTTAGGGAEILDAGLIISSSMFTSSLAPNLSSTASERGTSFTIANDTLTFAWNANTGLSVKGTGDAITAVSYTTLASIILQPEGHPDQRTSLATLFGNTTITCRP